MAKIKKTNAIRILERNGIDYKTYSYDASDGRIDGLSVAKKTGMNPEYIFKTLVARGGSRELYVFVVPVASELNLKKAARITEEKKIEMIAVKELLSATGYVRGGCSPVGMKKKYQTFIDSSAEGLDKIIISGGMIGLQIELLPESLMGITGGMTAELC